MTSARALLWSSSIGTIVEWYDFFVFASAAALVFDHAFFPRFDPRSGVLLALMTYAVGFATRPVGGALFGVLGDRFGRKRALVWSLMLMGVATMSVGLIPDYATIGFAAPLLLVTARLTQGLAVGGEVGGALLLVAETMSAERRGLWTGWPMIGGAAGNLLSAGALALLGAVLGDRAFAAWGWRLAFGASAVLVFVGIWVRLRIEESPLYREYLARRGTTERASIGRTLATHWRAVTTVLLVKAGENALFYVFSTFFVVYVTRVLHRPRALALEGAVVASITEIIAIFAAGAWSDRVGRRPVTALGLIAAALWGFVLFPVTKSGSPAAVLLAAGVGGICHGIIVGGMSAFFVELFPTAARYTGFSIGYQFATIFAGAVAPIIGLALLDAFGSTVPVSLYAAAMSIPALLCLVWSRETKGADLAAIS
ncbi:MAG TPA: MFS transporter [Gemmatimonadaceae bacterium]|nr:MFS transporter [Gemmatimonadaceae bacterium]